jgi:DNA-binding NtrC family response regulator
LPFKPLSETALEKLRRHDWPGNVRELQNVLERAAMLSRGELIHPADIEFDSPGSNVPFTLTAQIQPIGEEGEWRFPESVDGHWPSLEECEREFFAATLRHTGYNQAAAARLLNLDRSVLRRRIKKLGLDSSHPTPRPS